MELSKTTTLLKKKFLKIFSFLILIRLGLYIPVPNLDLDIVGISDNFIKNLLLSCEIMSKNIQNENILRKISKLYLLKWKKLLIKTTKMR